VKLSSKALNIEAIPLWMAILPLIFLMTLLAGAVYFFGDRASAGPSQIALITAATFAALLGIIRGQSWHELEQAIVDGITLVIRASLILLLIGSMIGSWMLAGTAPAIIYLGLGVLDPNWFYPAAMILCAIVAVSIGSSWTTAATVGLALIGISQVLGLSTEITAGAVISGAYFGDKMSPLSDSTNLAPAIAGVDLFVHIKHMFWTTTPSFIIALLLFTWLGWGGADLLESSTTIESTRATLLHSYTLGFPTFIPIILLLALSIMKVPAMPTIVLGTLAGSLVAVFYQNSASDLLAGGSLSQLKNLWTVLTDGYVANTGDTALDQLLSRGGMSSMLNTVWLILSAMCFGGIMEHTGFLRRIVITLLKGVHGTSSLILTTVLTSIGMNIVAADQYIAIVIPGRMYRLEFKRRGLAPENLSRTLEDAGTMTSALVPWNTCGAFMAATLGVPTLSYLPYAYLNLLNPLMAIIYGICNFKLTPLQADELVIDSEAVNKVTS
jgi:NhaC family Na+:H+ antiporter